MNQVKSSEVPDLSHIYEFAFKQISEGVVVHDQYGHIIHFNESALKILGLTHDQLIGKDSLDPQWKTFHLDGRPMEGHEHPAIQTLKSGISCENFKMGVSRPNGELKWILVNSNPIYNLESQKLSFVVVSFLDITEQNHQQNEILRTLKLSTLNEMSSGMLHDLNNPLSVINGHVQQVLKVIKHNELNKDELLEKLESIKKMSSRMISMMNSYKNYARDGRFDCPELVNIDDLLTEVSEVCSYQLRKMQVHLIIDISESFNFHCRVSIILQAIVNLVLNAGEAVRNANDKTITIKAVFEDNQAIITVADHGVGIPKEKQELIFQPFFSTKQGSQGIGIGLYSSHKMITSEGGQMSFQSDHTRTEFTVIIPDSRPLVSPGN